MGGRGAGVTRGRRRRPGGDELGGIPVAEGIEVRVSLARHAGRERVHLRTWYRAASGQWRPTVRGVTVAPEQLPDLEALVRAMRESLASDAEPAA